MLGEASVGVELRLLERAMLEVGAHAGCAGVLLFVEGFLEGCKLDAGLLGLFVEIVLAIVGLLVGGVDDHVELDHIHGVLGLHGHDKNRVAIGLLEALQIVLIAFGIEVPEGFAEFLGKVFIADYQVLLVCSV